MAFEEQPMELPKRAQKLEWNLNTIIQIITLLMMVIGGVTIWVNKGRDIEELQKWRFAAEERLKSIDTEVRKIDNIVYRVTVQEQTNATITSAMKELQSLINQQSGDLKVMKEILQRLEDRGPIIKR